MPMAASCCGVATLGESVDVLASGISILTRSPRAIACNSHWLSPVAWRKRLGPKSDVVSISVFVVVSRVVRSRHGLLIWAGSSYMVEAMRVA